MQLPSRARSSLVASLEAVGCVLVNPVAEAVSWALAYQHVLIRHFSSATGHSGHGIVCCSQRPGLDRGHRGRGGAGHPAHACGETLERRFESCSRLCMGWPFTPSPSYQSLSDLGSIVDNADEDQLDMRPTPEVLPASIQFVLMRRRSHIVGLLVAIADQEQLDTRATPEVLPEFNSVFLSQITPTDNSQ